MKEPTDPLDFVTVADAAAILRVGRNDMKQVPVRRRKIKQYEVYVWGELKAWASSGPTLLADLRQAKEQADKNFARRHAGSIRKKVDQRNCPKCGAKLKRKRITHMVEIDDDADPLEWDYLLKRPEEMTGVRRTVVDYKGKPGKTSYASLDLDAERLKAEKIQKAVAKAMEIPLTSMAWDCPKCDFIEHERPDEDGEYSDDYFDEDTGDEGETEDDVPQLDKADSERLIFDESKR